MGKFLTPLEVQQISEATPDRPAKFKLTDALVYDSKTIGLIIVPEGFITDFASVPRVPIAYLITGGLGNSAATLHDFLYTKPHSTMTSCVNPVTRKQADRVLRGAIIDGMSVDIGASIIGGLKSIYYVAIAHVMYLAVRCLGFRHWED